MSQILIKDVVRVIEEAFPPRYQEDYDNTGLQVGSMMRPCSGVLLCVDVTPEIVVEAEQKGCNLIVSHHPLIFSPLKNIVTTGRVDFSLYKAIKNDIAIYSCHTSVDNAPGSGVSWKMAEMLGLSNLSPLEAKGEEGIGCGVVGDLAEPMTHTEFVAKVKSTFGSPVARCSAYTPERQKLTRVALCGGAGGFLLPRAIECGAQAFIASDCKHNQFLDHARSIFLIDIGHFESEECTKQIFYQIIREKIPNFALYYSELEKNPIIYL
ncbi:MAG: Nif3-like dinuclear metal center hexameric protein [Muribaculaceae bacterium]|nr:Nif3-like dinuclear metal center hexameric protein [Muribaculaceae bacterium]MDE6346505.1 Nif3-like dinuclear metal center hexameric protein [Muribaculaceae bacterium]